MAKYSIEDSTLVAIGDAIREKSGTTETMTPAEMVAAISAIEGGGGSSEDVRYVTFMNGDTELYVKPVATGDDCVDVVAKGLIPAPTKASTAQYTYTHNGWSLTAGGNASSSALATVTEDRTVYAAYTASTRYYAVTYYDDASLLQALSLTYGADAGAAYNPEKTGYVFKGWSADNDNTVDGGKFTVNGDMVLYAVFEVGKQILASGTCGKTTNDNVTWAVDEDYTLTISGNGEMANYDEFSPKAPWRKDYASSIKRVVINDGVTSIGKAAFWENKATESVDIPNSVTSIGNFAFYYCNHLKSVTIPTSVTTIGTHVFYYCTMLENVTFDCNITEIPLNAFRNTSALISINIPNSVINIATSAFGSSGLTSIVIPDNVKTISSSAFYMCKSLSTVKMSNSATELGSTAFYGCTSLNSITIPASMTKIGKNTFKNCSALTSATFENTNGWWVSTDSAATSGTSIPASDLANASTAATRLTSDYAGSYWTRS